jgi:LPS-assembly protein
MGGHSATFAQEGPLPRLRMSTQLQPAAPNASSQPAAMVLRARAISGTPDAEVQAEGDVELRRAGLLLRADSLLYDSARDTATAEGHVRIPGAAVQHAQGAVANPKLSRRIDPTRISL